MSMPFPLNTSALQVSDEAPGPVKSRFMKVPIITATFWTIKILSTTVGETFADYLAVNVGLGPLITTGMMITLLAVALVLQFRTRSYTPWIYWLSVVLVSIVGTQITDFFTDTLGISLYVSTAIFTVLLIAVFTTWYFQERTLAITSIDTVRREAFYWAAILTAFALGTAAGDLATEALGLGFLWGSIIFGALIVACGIAVRAGAPVVAAFWVAYVLTRPLGASIGDLLTQDRSYGGMGVGAAVTSVLFLAVILILVVREQIHVQRHGVLTKGQTAAGGRMRDFVWAGAGMVAIVVAAATVTSLQAEQAPVSAATLSSATGAQARGPLGDLSTFSAIVDDVTAKIEAGDLPAARTRVKDLETAWDSAEAGLKPKSPAAWGTMDKAIDGELTSLRADHPDQGTCLAATHHLQSVIDSP
ncbi:COG4705 family protein [Paeniglutamicibacter cryotolerans]|uniref:Putative membrane-anchored protein n=1 Tax=Paeniglutamicibacter cryotolerans TaxID=670079 RepID=A0A839QW88_9MICC|nr:hypothetical protein [Paeniglutamicibacter cryotolerans]MBB2997572.1 putative membrane-anchored protein [Paeniglutamicibacter cryotolerans]